MPDLSAIDRFYDRVVKGLPYEDLERLERAPASEGIQDPNAVLRPLGSQMTQKEPTTVIDGGEIQPIEYPTNYKPKVPQSEIIRENVNYALQSRQRDAKNLSSNAKFLSESLNEGKGNMRSAIERLEGMGNQSYVPNQALEDRIKAAEADMNTPGQQPRDIWSEMILSFGPALAGAVTGEAGALSAPQAQKQGRELYEARRKEEGEQIKSKRERAQKVYDSLLKIREQDRTSFDKGLQREMDRLGKALQGREGLAKLDANDLQRTEDKINNINKEISEGIQKGSKEIADLERSDEIEKNKSARAKTMAGIALQKVTQPTQGERDAAARYGRAVNSAQNLNALGVESESYPAVKDPYFNLKSEAFKRGGPINMLIQNQTKDSGVRAAITAETEWGQNFLRDETGAAIKDEELPQELNKVFPRYGDSAEVRAQKAAIRKQYENGLIVQMGRAAPPKIEKPIPAPKNQTMTIEQKREALKKMGYK